MNDFDRAIEFIFAREGYKSELPGDPGGLTIWGISARAYPEDVSLMAKMTPEAAKGKARMIYFKDYWTPSGCESMAWPMNLCVLDAAINCGPGRAKSFQANATCWQDVLCNRSRWLLYESKSRYLPGLLNRVHELFKVSKEA